MEIPSFYDMLGVERDASLEEITNAKNKLAKIYHPDANLHNGIDTTAQMQALLSAYEVLSDAKKREKYDADTFGTLNRVFQTFTFEEGHSEPQATSFVACWNAVNHLHETVHKSHLLLKKHFKNRPKRLTFLQRLLLGKNRHQEVVTQLQELAYEASQYITLLTLAGINPEHWHTEAMNWVLVQWSANQAQDYIVLLNRYELLKKADSSAAERLQIQRQNRRFKRHIKILLDFQEAHL